MLVEANCAFGSVSMIPLGSWGCLEFPEWPTGSLSRGHVPSVSGVANGKPKQDPSEFAWGFGPWFGKARSFSVGQNAPCALVASSKGEPSISVGIFRSPANCPSTPFVGEGSLIKIDYRKSWWCPYSNLSTGGPGMV